MWNTSRTWSIYRLTWHWNFLMETLSLTYQWKKEINRKTCSLIRISCLQSLYFMLTFAGKLHPDVDSPLPYISLPVACFPATQRVVMSILINLGPNSIASSEIALMWLLKNPTIFDNYFQSHEWMTPHSRRTDFSLGTLVAIQDLNDSMTLRTDSSLKSVSIGKDNVRVG